MRVLCIRNVLMVDPVKLSAAAVVIGGRELSRRRQAMGMTHRGLGAILQVSKNTVGLWESERQAIPRWMAYALPELERQWPTMTANFPPELIRRARPSRVNQEQANA